MKSILCFLPYLLDSGFWLIFPLFGAVFRRNEAPCKDPGVEKIRNIFIPKNKHDALQDYFNRVKKPVLDNYLGGKYPGIREKTEFHFKDARSFTQSLRSILPKGEQKFSGVRIYFGSYEEVPGIPETDIKFLTKGQLMLILTPTREERSGKHKSIGRYWVINDADAQLVEFSSKTVHHYIDQYKIGKVKGLDATLAPEDITAGRSETYSVFFNMEIIDALCNEIDYQVCIQENLSNGVKLGVKVKLLSYDENPFLTPSSPSPYKLMQRLTIHFVLTNESSGGDELDMEEFDKTRYSDLLLKLSPSSWNTGNPTPPFPDDDQ